MGAYDMFRSRAGREKDTAILPLYLGHFAYGVLNTGHDRWHL